VPVDIAIPQRHITAPLIFSTSEHLLANSPQARKRSRQAEKRRRHNASQRSMVRTYIKRVNAAIESNDYESADAALSTAIPVLDRMASKGIMHKNKASRHKSRMSKQVAALLA
jgi:small subunit ribosomal protein S20